MRVPRTWKEAHEMALAEAAAEVAKAKAAAEAAATKAAAAANARAVLTVLQTRGIVVPDAARERILAQTDPKRLERWLEKAVVAASVAEVIGKPRRAA
jgi:hypothetical protein